MKGVIAGDDRPFELPLEPGYKLDPRDYCEEDWAEFLMGHPRFTKIVDRHGTTVTAAHDLFEFSPHHAERLCTAVNMHDELLAAVAELGTLSRALIAASSDDQWIIKESIATAVKRHGELIDKTLHPTDHMKMGTT